MLASSLPPLPCVFASWSPFDNLPIETIRRVSLLLSINKQKDRKDVADASLLLLTRLLPFRCCLLHSDLLLLFLDPIDDRFGVFRILDLDKDQRLSSDEVEAHWSNINRARPSNVMADDADNDGYISWDEFTGPKGTSAD